jgi:hypothetical protein
MKFSRISVCILLLLSFAVSFAQFEIKIDAEKDAFYNTLTGPDDGLLWIPSIAYNDNGVPPDDDWDLSAYLYSAWDSTYFYVYEEVTDDIVNQNSATEYQNDVFEVKIDPDPYMMDDNTVWATDLTCMDSSDADESVWAGIDNLYTTSHNWAGTESPTYDDFARKLTDTGYVLELRLKWEWIATANKGPVIAEVGNIFGLAYMNHDNDDITRDSSIEWAAVLLDAAWNDCKNHGSVEFLADHKLKYTPENQREPNNFYPNPEIYIPPATGVSGKLPVAQDFCLDQNYPNPFNPVTTISYTLQKTSKVRIDVTDIRGQEVAVLVDNVMQSGKHTLRFDGSGLSSGIYFYRLGYAGHVLCKKMTLIK